MVTNKKAIVIDGNSMFYRMYYATINQVEYALSHNYVINNAIKLMLNTVIKLIQSNACDYFFIAFDAHKKTFRHNLLESYKQNRTKTPDELIKQMNDTIIALKAMGINVQAIEEIEADDLVGSFAKIMNDNNIDVNIYSSDKDLLQLVNDQTTVYLMKTGISKLEEYNKANFKEKFFNLEPKQIIDYKAIIGDTSDCLPGVKGIGQKIGIKLINEYGSLENIYNNLQTLSKTNQSKFIESKETAFLCKKMATILDNVFKDKDISEFEIKSIDYETLYSILDKYKLGSIKEALVQNKLGS